MEESKMNPNDKFINLRDELMKSKVEFSQIALNECLTFLSIDNKIVSHFEEIIYAVKEDIKKNPNKFYANPDVSNDIEGIDHINKIGFLSGLGGLIKDVIIKDKDLIIRIIEKVFKL